MNEKILDAFLSDLQELEYYEYDKPYDYSRIKTWVTVFYKVDFNTCEKIIREVCRYNTFIACKCIDECYDGYDELSDIILQCISRNTSYGKNKMVSTFLTYLELKCYKELEGLISSLHFFDVVNPKDAYQFYGKIFMYYNNIESYRAFLKIIADSEQRKFFSVILELSPIPIICENKDEISDIVKTLFDYHNYYSVTLMIDKLNLHQLENILGEDYYLRMKKEIASYDEKNSDAMIQIIGAMEIEFLMLCDRFKNNLNAAHEMIKKQLCNEYPPNTRNYYLFYVSLKLILETKDANNFQELIKEIKNIESFDYDVIKIRKKPVKLLIECFRHCIEQEFDITELLMACGDKNYFCYRKGEDEWLYSFPLNLTYPYQAYKCLEILADRKITIDKLVFIYMNTHFKTMVPLNQFVQLLLLKYPIKNKTIAFRNIFSPYPLSGKIERVNEDGFFIRFNVVKCNQKIYIKKSPNQNSYLKRSMNLLAVLEDFEPDTDRLIFTVG